MTSSESYIHDLHTSFLDSIELLDTLLAFKYEDEKATSTQLDDGRFACIIYDEPMYTADTQIASLKLALTDTRCR